jgi:hypothetical protein
MKKLNKNHKFSVSTVLSRYGHLQPYSTQPSLYGESEFDFGVRRHG